MINERLEAEEYIAGKNIKKSNLYRICYMMAKYHREQGLTAYMTRKTIFEWANDNKVWLKFNLNDILNMVYVRDYDPLHSDKVVRISSDDVSNINERFDHRNVKLTALALLCYAKAYGNKKGHFTCTGTAMASWIGIGKTAFFKYVQELILLGYIEQVDTTHSRLNRWQDRPLIGVNGNTYQILCSYDCDDGEYELHDNDIVGLYDMIFV